MKQNIFSYIKISRKVVLVLFALSLLAASCGGNKNKAENIELTIWKPFVDSQSMQSIIQAYQQTHPNVRINYFQKDETTYEADLVDALAENRGPDIFSIHNSWLPKYQNKVVPAPEEAWRFVDFRSDFLDVVTADFTRDNRIFGAAMSVDNLALFYNKDQLATAGFSRPPRTWDEFVNYSRVLSVEDQTGYFVRSGAAMGLSSTASGGAVNRAEDILYLLMLQRGVVSWTENGGQPRFADSQDKDGKQTSPGLAATDFYTSFARSQTQNYSWNVLSDYSIDAFANGRAAMMLSYSYTLDTIRQKAPTLNFGVAPVPQLALGQNEVNFANYWGEVVSRQSKHQEAAWDFLKFATSKEQLQHLYSKTPVPTSRKDLVDQQSADPDLGVFADAGLTARSFYRPDQQKVDAIFARLIDQITLRSQPVDRALQEASQQASSVSLPRN